MHAGKKILLRIIKYFGISNQNECECRALKEVNKLDTTRLKRMTYETYIERRKTVSLYCTNLEKTFYKAKRVIQENVNTFLQLVNMGYSIL